MSNVIKMLTDKASTLIENKGEQWLEKLDSEAREYLNENVKNGAVRKGAEAELDVLMKHKAVISKLSAEGFAFLVQQVTLGNEEEARLAFIRDQATVDDLIAISNMTADEVIADKKRREAMQAQAVAISKELLQVGLRFALPVLISLI